MANILRGSYILRLNNSKICKKESYRELIGSWFYYESLVILLQYQVPGVPTALQIIFKTSRSG